MTSHEGYTGRIFEQELFPSLSESWRNEGYFDEAKSYEWVRNNQVWNPSDPSTKLANELHYRVAEALGLEDINDLKLYSALNSPLDYYYGIDAFFECGDMHFSLDLSLNEQKKEGKADMIVRADDVLDENAIERTGKAIALYMRSQISEGMRAAA